MKYHMLRHDKEITDEETLKKILKTTQYVTLAMVKDSEPYLVSLSHGYDEEKHCIYFHSPKKGKNSTSCVQVPGSGAKPCWITATSRENALIILHA